MKRTLKIWISTCVLIFASIAGTGSINVVDAQIDGRGIYFNRFVGGFNGIELFELTTNNGTNFNLRDVYGGGFTGTIDPAGLISINGFPDGMFSDPDNFVIFPSFGGSSFTFTSNRIPTTTVDFPLRLASPRPADPLLAGQWTNTLRQINPETGQPGGPGTEQISVTVNGNTVRITDPGGLFFQGVFENGLTAGYRVISNPFFGTPPVAFRTFPGSATNIGQDLLGEMNMVDINTFRATFILQSRQQLGNQTVTLFEFNAVRTNPLAEGDVNGDGVVDSTDGAIVDSLVGSTFEDDDYQIAADINGDGVIDEMDADFFGPTESIAQAINIVRGNLISGTAVDANESDDSYFVFQPGFTLNSTEPPIWLLANTVVPSLDTELTLQIEANANTPNISQVVEAFDFSTGQFVQVGQQNLSFNFDAVIDIDVDFASFVQAGTGDVLNRVGYRSNGFTLLFPWTVSIDQFLWVSE